MIIESDDQSKFDLAQRHQKLKLILEHSVRKLSSGGDVAEILLRSPTAAEQLGTQAEPQTCKTMTSAELDEAELNTEYLVEDVLARHQSTIIAAAKKSLKTNVAIDLTLSFASCCPFLGKFWIPKAVRVAMMSGESGDPVIQETARRIARSKSWPNLSDYENTIWSFDLPRLGRPETKRDLNKFIGDNRLEVLIVDPAYLCLDLGDDAGNLFAVGKKLSDLTEIQHETGCTIVIIHHNKKSMRNSYDILKLESIAWSGFQEWARQWLLIGRRNAYDPETKGSHQLWFSIGGSAGHSGLFALDIEEGSRKDRGGRRWDVTVRNASTAIRETIEQRELDRDQAKQAKADRQVASDSAKLLKQYRKTPLGETAKFYRESAGLNGQRSILATQKLIEAGLIEPVTVTKNGREYDGFRLKQEPLGPAGSSRV